MDCKNVEREIILEDVNNLSLQEKEELKRHVEGCPSCKETFAGVKEYKELVDILSRTEPQLSGFLELSNSIMAEVEAIEFHKKKNVLNSRKRVLQTTFRIAASITIFFTIGFFFQQKLYINRSIIALEESYNRSVENEAFVNNYTECIESSEGYFKELFTSNQEIIKLVDDLPNNKSTIKLEKYASHICRLSYLEYSNASIELKKQLVIEFLETNLKSEH